jgi:NAD(P)H-dependent flavin oxidoreductase YrpB (nitropropane dioxygenase family)
MLTTRLSNLLGIEFPIFSAPMGPDLRGPELVAAVSGTGGLGLMEAQLSPPADFREQIRRVRSTTDKPFGCNFVLALPHEEDLRVASGGAGSDYILLLGRSGTVRRTDTRRGQQGLSASRLGGRGPPGRSRRRGCDKMSAII